MASNGTQMSVEIGQQPEAVAATIDRLRAQRRQLTALGSGIRQVLFVARGSSDNACVYARYLVETHAGRLASLAAPSVATQYHTDIDLTDCLVVCVSQSGETQEIVQALDWAKRNGARTVGVTNGAESALARSADAALVTMAGKELAVPATKTYTTQLAALTLLASALAPRPDALDADLDRVPQQIATLIERRTGIDAAAELLRGTSEVLVSGRGLLFGTALEIALKLEETCLRPVRGLSYADLKHGPIAVVDDQMVTVLVAPQDGPVLGGLTEMATELRDRGATVIGVGGDEAFMAACTHAVAGPDLPETVAPLATVVPGQLMVETLARRMGLDPDAPRGLSKVTQTDHR